MWVCLGTFLKKKTHKKVRVFSKRTFANQQILGLTNLSCFVHWYVEFASLFFFISFGRSFSNQQEDFQQSSTASLNSQVANLCGDELSL